MSTDSNLTLYSAPTGNGRKPAVILEELELNYNYIPVNILKGDQLKPEYIIKNPNGKIPTLVDHQANDFTIFESGAILIYLAEKYNKFLPKDSLERSTVLQWLFFQNANIGPIFGQFGHFYKYAGDKCDHPYPLERYTKESKRLLKVMDTRLSQSRYLGGEEYTIADISTFPWVGVLVEYFQAQEILELDNFKYLQDWYLSCMEREATKKAYQRINTI